MQEGRIEEGLKRFHQPAGNSPLCWKIRLAKLTNQFFSSALIEAGTSTELGDLSRIIRVEKIMMMKI